MIDEFLESVSAYGGLARRVPTSGAARTTVSAMLDQLEARSLCFWEGDALVAALDPASLRAAAVPALADAGITGADCAVASTGTLALSYGEGRGRDVGLLPDVHIVVLAADRIVANLPGALALCLGGGRTPPAALTLITGLSATSDIEKIRITGVHGPRRLGVVVVG
ncbi:MAG: LUD domain-containing protein [Gaiellales bacterium]